MNSLKSSRDETREIMSMSGRTSMMFYEFCDPAKTIQKIPVQSRQHAKDTFLATIILLFSSRNLGDSVKLRCYQRLNFNLIIFISIPICSLFSKNEFFHVPRNTIMSILSSSPSFTLSPPVLHPLESQ